MFRFTTFVLLFFVTLALVRPATSQDLPGKAGILSAYRIQASITLDGILSEPQWQEAKRIPGLTQHEPLSGIPGQERTEIAVLYDDDNLYIGFWGYDSNPDEIVAKKLWRDFGWGDEDNFQIIIDPYDDDRNGYLFAVNANGAIADALVADNGFKYNADWDGVWECAARITDEGWFAEIVIPLSNMRFHEGEETQWGINFEREVMRTQETMRWTGWESDRDFNQVSEAGTLAGLRRLHSPNLVDIRPYGVGGMREQRNTDVETVFDAGLDVDYRVTPTTRLSLTVNPDFAQVESDRLQINLTRFSIFYPEKRKFFLEGKEFFDFQMGFDTRPFYSRRIGLDEDGNEIPIIGGLRMLQKDGSSSLGALVMQTAEHGESATANYAAARYKHDILEQSHIGFLGVNKIQDGEVNTVYAGDFRYSTSSFMGDKNLSGGVILAQSLTSDRAEKHGGAQRVYIAYPNDFLDAYAVASRVDDRFNPEVGYLKRRSFRTYYTRWDFEPRPSFLPFIRKFQFRPLELDYYESDETGELENLNYTFRPLAIQFQSGDEIKFDVVRLAERIPRRFNIFGDVYLEPDTYWYTQYWVQGGTSASRPLSMSGWFATGEFYNGNRTFWGGGTSWKLSKHLILIGEYSRSDIELPNGAFSTEEVAGRVNFATSSKLFGSVFAQYNNEHESILLNFRINWIPKPGADVYLVVNQAWAKEDSEFLLTDTTILSKVVWRFEM
ncbi:MAG: hypothetical protein CL946_11525 [Ectothiorhodospiraceae bacterium]|nr:hypothetical protein [Ectothiorhodospiraceae bacterium]